MTNCPYFPTCTGCSLWNLPYQQQKNKKITYLQGLIEAHNLDLKADIDFISCGEHSLRHRIDFTLEYDTENKKHKLGFYDQNKKLQNIESCLQLTPELQKIYTEFMQLFIQFGYFYESTPVKKGSVRLRVGTQGLKGCWLDFSNIEIKQLLEDQKLLGKLLDAGFTVEIGQKSKKLVRINNQPNGLLKLTTPEPNFWFKTINYEKQALDLKCLISDFTQPSWLSAVVLVNEVSNWIEEISGIKNILEFGAGIGQFTLCFLSHNINVEVCEIDKSATNQLKLNEQLYAFKGNLSVYLGDFHKNKISHNNKYDLVFVNPGRSGLKNFTNEIKETEAEYLIYVSCFPETMTTDLAELAGNYSLCNIKIIDQFPQTNHFETLTLLKKITRNQS